MLDARQFGKRYGMAQCTRDISRTDCKNCLYTQLEIGEDGRCMDQVAVCSTMITSSIQTFPSLQMTMLGDSLQGVAIGITMAGLVFIFLPYSFIGYSIMLRSKLCR